METKRNVHMDEVAGLMLLQQKELEEEGTKRVPDEEKMRALVALGKLTPEELKPLIKFTISESIRVTAPKAAAVEQIPSANDLPW